MPYTLIICEKPQASMKIAQALAQRKPEVIETPDGVKYYELNRDGKRHVVVPAVGHLFLLKDNSKSGWQYPVYDYEWKPTYEINKKAFFAKKYFENLQRLAKDATDFIVATDYDQEGAVLGYNILRFLCGENDAKRMKFSTLVKEDLIESYQNKMVHLDFPQIEAGLTRHELDFLWGINITRALTLSLKVAGKKLSFYLLSAGRVQAPMLHILFEKEKEIAAFKPDPFWQIEAKIQISPDLLIVCYHEADKFWKKDEAENIYKKCKDKKAIVDEIKTRRYKQAPPTPFDLTTLQTEAYRFFGWSPKQTTNIAEGLYQSGHISYPRTSSQRLPPQIGYQNILKKLAELKPYSKLAEKLLKGELKPNEGKKEDPAHPSVYPTSEVPDISKLNAQQKKLYDLIVRRFLAVFAAEATRESMQIIFLINGEKFPATGRRTIEKGWMEFYGHYAKVDEIVFPPMKKGDTFNISELNFLDKETTPPPRYSQGSIVKELDKKNVGTKCLAGDTLVRIKHFNEIKDVKISELFDKSLKTDINDGGAEIALNKSNFECFTLNESKVTESLFALVSKRESLSQEKIFEITFSDGSSVVATEEHPFYVYENNKIKLKLTKDLKANNKTLCSIKIPEFYGKTICTWETFLNGCNKKTKIYTKHDIKEYRKSKNLTQYELADKLNISQSKISEYEKKKSIPLYVLKNLDAKVRPEEFCGVNKKLFVKNPFSLTLSTPLVRIMANLKGDGSIDSVKLKAENCYDYRYSNTNLLLLERFAQDIESIFNFKPQIRKDNRKFKNQKQKYYIRLPSLIGRILAIVTDGVTNENIANFIGKEFYPHCIGAMFDDEGHVYKDEAKLFISNTKFSLLKSLQYMLSSLNIKSALDFKQYKLFIRGRWNVQRFLELIPFISLKKKNRLINILTTKYVYRGKEPLVLREKRILSEIANTEKDLQDIVKLTGYEVGFVNKTLNVLTKLDYVSKQKTGNNRYVKRKVYYKLKIPLYNTFYNLVGETLLSKEIATKLIKNVNEIQYSGYVYDLTNKNSTPNFVLSNGVIVHNSTRAQILQTLYDRGYILGKSIEVTELGMQVAETLSKYVPEIVSEELTRKFEREMESIEKGKRKREKVVNEAKKILGKITEEFKEHENDIGRELEKAVLETKKQQSLLGPCPNCGNMMKILFSPRTKKRFAGCSSYPKCKTGFALPLQGTITSLGKSCEECKSPMIQVWRKGRRPFRMCLDSKCITKKDWGKPKENIVQAKS